MDLLVEKHRRNLPHLQLRDQIISVTWRLAGTLPKPVRLMLEDLRRTQAETAREQDPSASSAAPASLFQGFDDALGRLELPGLSLTKDQLAAPICDTLRFYDARLYLLHAHCVMPNHLHLLIQPLPQPDGTYARLSVIVKLIKTYTTKQANQRLGRRGSLWQEEYFDRYIRDPDDYYTTVNYILENPVRAGLADKAENWPYSYYKPGLI